MFSSTRLINNNLKSVRYFASARGKISSPSPRPRPPPKEQAYVVSVTPLPKVNHFDYDPYKLSQAVKTVYERFGGIKSSTVYRTRDGAVQPLARIVFTSPESAVKAVESTSSSPLPVVNSSKSKGTRAYYASGVQPLVKMSGSEGYIGISNAVIARGVKEIEELVKEYTDIIQSVAEYPVNPNGVLICVGAETVTVRVNLIENPPLKRTQSLLSHLTVVDLDRRWGAKIFVGRHLISNGSSES